MKSSYKQCRHNGKRMRLHRAIIRTLVESWEGWTDGEIAEYMDNIIVHHKDGDKLNNKRSNLVIMTRSKHSRLHAKRQKRNAKGRFV